MNTKNLVAAGVRFYALMLLFRVIDLGLQALLAFNYWRTSQESLEIYMAVAAGLSFVLHVAVAAFLLLRTDTVVRWVAPGLESEPEAQTLPASRLMGVAFSVAGLVFLVGGLERLSAIGAEAWLGAGGTDSYTRGAYRVPMERLVPAAVATAAGLWLLLRSRGIVGLIRWLQSTPRSPPVEPEENRGESGPAAAGPRARGDPPPGPGRDADHTQAGED